MPVHIRTFYVQQIIKTKEEEQKQIDKANKKPSSSDIARPDIPQR